MLDERNKQVLCAVIQCYINSPGPVGSRVVTKKYAFGLSSATIRNIMSDLEEMGYLQQPHTSAGRVPTDSGYRYYVDILTAERRNSNNEQFFELYKKLETLRKDINTFPDETSKMLSALSHYIGITMSPNTKLTTLTKIEFLKYRWNQVAVILFTDEGIVKNKIVLIDSDISQKELNRLAEYINSEFVGHTLDKIRKTIVKEMTRERILCDKLISDAIKICKDVFSSSPGNIFISGLSEMLELPDFCEINRIKELMRTIDDKRIIVNLLDSISDFVGTQVFIGSENPLDEMKSFSMVVSTYKDNKKPVGAIGIIGPKRMNYIKAISIVDMTANYISNVLLP
jgi:heat-inducible transcriptional repressor